MAHNHNHLPNNPIVTETRWKTSRDLNQVPAVLDWGHTRHAKEYFEAREEEARLVETAVRNGTPGEASNARGRRRHNDSVKTHTRKVVDEVREVYYYGVPAKIKFVQMRIG